MTDKINDRTVRQAKQGDKKAIRYIFDTLENDLRNYVFSEHLFLNGGDKEDLLQAGRLGIWKSISDYKENSGRSFKNFAITICAKRMIITCINHANARKYEVLNHSGSFEFMHEEDTYKENKEQKLLDMLDTNTETFENSTIRKTEFEHLMERLQSRLTESEKQSLQCYMDDMSYSETARYLGINEKAHDNCMLRIRKKAKVIYQNSQELN